MMAPMMIYASIRGCRANRANEATIAAPVKIKKKECTIENSGIMRRFHVVLSLSAMADIFVSPNLGAH